MDRTVPSYFPGDTIKLKIKFHHQVYLADVWANFEKQEEVTALAHFQFTARLRSPDNLRLLDQAGTQMISEAVLEAAVVKDTPLPGTYELFEVRGLPLGEERAERSVLTFEVPKDIRFNVVAPPIDQPPRVLNWELGWESQPQVSEAAPGQTEEVRRSVGE